MKSGHMFTVGSSCNQKNNLLVLTNVQSQFCSHGFAFGDENQKKMLTTDIQEIIDSEYPDIRKLSKITINAMVMNGT